MKTITGKIIALAIAVSGLIFSQSANAACNMPTTLSTTAITSTAATLNWSGGSSAIGFNLRYRVVGNSTWITTTSTVSPKALSGLSSSSSYEWQVQTRCSNTQTSNWTGSSTFATLIVCNTPTGLSTTSITSTGATLNWSTVTGASIYNVQYRIVGAPSWTSTSSTTNSKSLTSLTAFSNYEWQVQTNCGGSNTSAFSASATFSTPLPPCNVPAGLNTTGISATGATLNWSSVSGAVNYNVQYRIVGAPSWTPTTSSTTSTTIASLTASSNYEWQVQTNCGNSNLSAFSASSTFSTLAPPCNVPTGLYVANNSATSINLKWDPMTNAAGYNIQYRQTGAPSWTSLSSVTNVITLSSLTASTSYEWKVQTDCGNSNVSAFSSINTFTTQAAVVICYVPGGLNVQTSTITSTSAILNWTASQNSTGYNVEYRAIGAPSWISVATTAATLTLTSLTPVTNYEFQVQSNCGNSNLSAFSSSVPFSTSAATPSLCDVPNGLIALIAGITSTSANVSWTPSLSTVTSYDVQYRQVGAPSWTSISSTTASASISSLIPSTNYEWQVQSDCGINGVSGFSGQAVFTTAAPLVCNVVPTSLSSSSITARDVSLSWVGGLEASVVGGVAGYEVQYRQTGAPSWTSIFTTTPYVVIPSLLPAMTYEWQVRTDCGSSNYSSFSSTLTFTTLSHSAPNTATGPNPPIDVIPNLSDSSTWNVIFVSSGDLATDEQIVHDWMLLHGIIKQ